MKKLSLLLLGTLVCSGALRAQSSRETLLVLSKGDHTLAIVDPQTSKVVARAPVGEDPHEVSASADGKMAYVSIYGGGAYNTLSVIDLVAGKALAPIDLGPLRGPHGLIFKGGKLWFTAEGAKAIGSFDPSSQKVDWILGTGQDRTHMIYVADDLKHIFTTNVNSATVSVIENGMQSRPPGFAGPPPGRRVAPRQGGPPAGGPIGPPGGQWEETVVPVGKGAEGFDVSPDGRELWAANAGDGTISVIDIAGKKVIATLPANVPGANRLKFTPDGRLVFVSSLNGTDLVVLEAAARKEVKRLPIGNGAAGIQMQPNGSRAYVACTPDNYVAIIDVKSLTVTGHIDAGKNPDGMAWAVQK